MQEPVGLVEGTDQAATLLHPVRMQLLERFRDPSSAAEVARDLELPRQRVGHHVRLLREHGLLESVGERRKGNFVEQMLQTTARAYVIVPQALGRLAGSPEAIRDRFSSEYLAVLAARTLRDLAILRRHADRSGKRLATLSLETEVRFASPAEQSAFAQELTAALEGLVSKYHAAADTPGRSFRFNLCGYPSLDGEQIPANDSAASNDNGDDRNEEPVH